MSPAPEGNSKGPFSVTQIQNWNRSNLDSWTRGPGPYCLPSAVFTSLPIKNLTAVRFQSLQHPSLPLKPSCHRLRSFSDLILETPVWWVPGFLISLLSGLGSSSWLVDTLVHYCSITLLLSIPLTHTPLHTYTPKHLWVPAASWASSTYSGHRYTSQLVLGLSVLPVNLQWLQPSSNLHPQRPSSPDSGLLLKLEICNEA